MLACIYSICICIDICMCDLQVRDRGGAPREENLHTNTAKNRVPGGFGGVDGGAHLQAGALLSTSVRHAAARSSRAASLAALAGDAGDSDGSACMSALYVCLIRRGRGRQRW